MRSTPPTDAASAITGTGVTPDHLDLLISISELSASLAGSTDIRGFLQQIVAVVADHIQADVCSIYIYEEPADELVLKATQGLRDDAVDRVRLRLGEGLVGKALADVITISEQHASDHPSYRFFDEIDEEHYQAFVAVPIVRGTDRIGVLVAQRTSDNQFTPDDVRALQVTASNLAGVIENARILISLHYEVEPTVDDEPKPTIGFVRGDIACEGIARAKSLILDRKVSTQAMIEDTLGGTYTMADFERALKMTETQLEDLQASLEDKMPEVADLIFSAHMLMLRDKEFTGRIRQLIEGGKNPAAAIMKVGKAMIELFAVSKSASIREKVKDIEDLTKRLLANLVNRVLEPTAECQAHIVIADDLYPSDVLKLSSEEVAGIVLVSGGVTSHVSILARSLGIPMIISDHPELLKIPSETDLLLDAEDGVLYIEPGEDVIERIEERRETSRISAESRKDMQPETYSADGVRVRLLANINLLSDLEHAAELKAEGVGLYRSEFPFLIRPHLPSEQEQHRIYHSLIQNAPGYDVTFRTLDIGGDKVTDYIEDTLHQNNPNLGLRSIRFSLRHKQSFHDQLTAFLRAAANTDKKVRIMFPMISSIDEFREAKHEVELCMEKLKAANQPYCKDPSIGIMVEVPSLVEIIEDIAKEAAFFCVGTNDFIQFLLAVDRGNEKVAPYYLPHHPAVLRGLKRIVAAARANHIPVSVCGEMAHEPRYIPFLLGIGLRRLSIDPRYIPHVQRQIAGLNISELEARAETILQKSTIKELDAYFKAES